MFLNQITNADVEYHHQQVRAMYASAQRLISINGLREIVGNTFIQMGSHIHGKAKDACDDVEARQASRHLLATGMVK